MLSETLDDIESRFLLVQIALLPISGLLPLYFRIYLCDIFQIGFVQSLSAKIPPHGFGCVFAYIYSLVCCYTPYHYYLSSVLPLCGRAIVQPVPVMLCEKAHR